MNQPNRLPRGGRVDRTRPLSFTFNGTRYQGFEGDTLASALLANNVDVVGRSFKYSRARGIVASGAEEPNAIFQVGGSEATTIPNLRATQTELYQDLVCDTVNGWPSVNFDMMGAVGKVGGAMMPPGFYYKTFMRPQTFWPVYEKYIRKAAGMGYSPRKPDPDDYDKMNHHCDVMVVGGGPAGLAAALAAARSGARVIIADEQNEFGGHLLGARQVTTEQASDEHSPLAWVGRAVAELQSMGGVTLLPRSTVFGYFDHNFLGILERRTNHLEETSRRGPRERIHRVRAGEVVLATGAHERPLVFANNDVPGCMLAGAVSTYINRYGVVPGNALVLMTTNDDAYQTALDWHSTGRRVVAIIDTRPTDWAQGEGDLEVEARRLGIQVIKGAAVIDVKGKKRVSGAVVCPIDRSGEHITGPAIDLLCDTVASSGGWSPIIHLACHTGSRPQWQADIAGFVPGKTEQRQHCAGGVNGTYALPGVLEEGFRAGAQAARLQGRGNGEFAEDLSWVKAPAQAPAMALYHIPHIRPTSRAPKQFVDYQNDVTAAAIELAIREGFESIEHVKRYTAMGFGTDQGKLGNINGMAIAAKALGRSIPETGTTIFRPMYTPVTFGALAGSDAGHLFDPARFTPMHPWHLAHGAKFEDVGQWKRPWYFPKPGESMRETLDRECLATRNSVGIMDASTLGKIDIQGPDAREFLNRIYTSAWSKLGVGKCRYGVMCKDDGMIFDDGVTACLNDNHFLMTTTTGGAAGVLQWLELWHQTEWPELEVYFTSVTDHWATITVSGPCSREVLGSVCRDLDLSKEAFPFMSWQEGLVACVPARVFRISFTGELSYEINVQANYGLKVWEAVMAAGEPFGITPYGTETMHILRAEKGFIIVGQDTDGSVTPQDMNMNWAVGTNKAFHYIGKRSWDRADNRRKDRKQMVGLKTKDPNTVLPEGAQIVLDPAQPIPMDMVGHVTSSYYSACLGYSIALALIKGGLERMGQSVFLPLSDGRILEAEICSPVFYDPKGERQNV